MATNILNPSDKTRNRAAWISAIASILIFAIKVFAYRLTGSAISNQRTHYLLTVLHFHPFIAFTTACSVQGSNL
jgi:hypothetical protein